MNDNKKTKKQLISELLELRHKIEDIDKHKNDQKDNLDSFNEYKSRYKALFDRSLNCIFLYDFEGNVYDANETALRLFGYTKEEVNSLNVLSLIPEEQIPIALERIEEIKRKGSTTTPMQYRAKNRSGEYIWVEMEGAIVYKEGKPYAIQGMAKDITEHKEAEKRLLESEEKYRAVFENTGTSTIIFDQDLKILMVNKEAVKHSGYSKEALEGNMKVTDFVADDDLSRIMEYHRLRSIGSDEAPKNYEFRFKDKHGNMKDCFLTIDMIPDTKHRVVSVLDITDRKIIEEQNKSSLREKEILLREIHHRVKNNMQIISSLLKLSSESIQDVTTLNIFRESQDRIKSMALIHEILYQSTDLTRIDFSIYIKSLVNEICRAHGVDLDRITLRFSMEHVPMDIDSAIPSGLIVNELITNAIKHAFPQETKGEIHISLSGKGNGVIELILSDNGIGMPSAIDLSTTKTLGLYIVKILVKDQLEGNITLDRTKGTIFRITFSNKNEKVK